MYGSLGRPARRQDNEQVHTFSKVVDHLLSNRYIIKVGQCSTEMGKVASVGGRRLQTIRFSKGVCDTSRIRITDPLASTIAQPPIFKASAVYNFFCLILLATTYPSSISANVNTYSSYSCSTNMICQGDARETEIANTGIQVGALSLIWNPSISGLAYYNQPVRFLDDSGKVASFTTAFAINSVVMTAPNRGDGMAFVISADNTTLGDSGGHLGIFEGLGTTPFKSIVVEFDAYQNADAPVYDISDNHISFDFSNITTNVTINANASDASVLLGSDGTTLYAWVEYNAQTYQLSASVSYESQKPDQPLLSYKVDLSDKVEEYMWVGFSAGSGPVYYDKYYVGDWNFSSDGINPASEWIFHLIPASKTGKLSSVALGFAVGVPVSVLACIFIVVFVRRRGRLIRPTALLLRRRQQGGEHSEDHLSLPIEGMVERFNYDQLSVATEGFSEESKLGEGGFGSVYRGVLPSSGIPVAVKKISNNSNQGEREFMAEVCIINQSRHRNLIELLGWCKDASKSLFLLVYELMPNGSVDRWVFTEPEEPEPVCLSWPLRFNIVKGTAAALEYLHHNCKRQVIHRDVKASNIMLDKEFNAKLGDFGLSQLVDHQEAEPTTQDYNATFGYTAPEGAPDCKTAQFKSTGVAGTPGYIAPEALVSRRCTDKTDVYAFGVVVLEVACGRKAYSRHVPQEEQILVDWVWSRMSKGELLKVVEKRLGDYDPKWMDVMLKVGLLCTHDDPQTRPSMKLVVQMLDGNNPVPPIPKRSVHRQNLAFHDSFDINQDAWSTSKSKLALMQLLSRKGSDSSSGFTTTSSDRNMFSNSNISISKLELPR